MSCTRTPVSPSDRRQHTIARPDRQRSINRGQRRSSRLAAWAAAAALGAAAGGCGSMDPSLHIQLLTPDGMVPGRYTAVLMDPTSRVWAAHCPEHTDAAVMRCTSDGVEIGPGVEVQNLTIKAPGYAFRSLTRESMPGAHRTVTLEQLEPWEQTEDWATGLPSDTGLDTFLSYSVLIRTELGPAYSIKFYLEQPWDQPRVYLINTRRHPLHYDFVRSVLGRPESLAQYEAATYHGADRVALAGSLVYYPELELKRASRSQTLSAPITLQFFPSDDLAPDQALLAHRLLEERLLFTDLAGRTQRLVYVPAGEHQQRELTASRRPFDAQGALWCEQSELYAGVAQQILNPGTAYGTLRRLSPAELETAAVSSEDIVVLPRLPNDLPVVGGTITEELQTPLAHVNLAARARGTPNLALPRAATDERVAPWLGQLVRFQVTDSGFSIEPATWEEAQAFWAARLPERLVLPSDCEYAELPGFDQLQFSDSLRVGAKAANLGELRQLLGEQAPAGFAVPFSAYHRYMSSAQVTASLCAEATDRCRTLGYGAASCSEADRRCQAAAEERASFYRYVDSLLSEPEFSSRSELRRACLASVEFLVAHGRVSDAFGERLAARVQEVFGPAQVRLRSSTNAEDLPGFSGAGLYRSVSANAGDHPSASERIPEVWASAWSWRAFEERTLWGIDHSGIRVGVAVNAAVDDEQANGVLITQNIADPNTVGLYVNLQLGETSITNPDDGSLPEIFSLIPAPSGGAQVARQRFSSLSPEHPILSDAEVNQLSRAAIQVQAHFAPLYKTDPSELALDLEFKFYGPERRLLIKQARPYAAR
ncbi:PEP/pyruvate-binding domain-containing protein [Myxococcota bacterium]